MNKYLEKIAANSLPIAVIIKGNPKYLSDSTTKPMADKFYENLKKLVSSKGYQVEFNAGEPFTSPRKDAAVWIGHSRGVDRLQYATKKIKTIELTTNDTHHIHGDADKTGKDPKHYQLSQTDINMINTL